MEISKERVLTKQGRITCLVLSHLLAKLILILSFAVSDFLKHTTIGHALMLL